MKTTLILTVLIVLSVVFGAQLAASDQQHESDAESGWMPQRTAEVAGAANEKYRKECGSCHLAYPAGLLPARSWQKLMGGLNDHFGDNAELTPELTRELTDYLLANSADASGYRRSEQINRSIKADEIPLRITDTAFFRREHHELPARLVKDNAQVKSFSNCNACHQRAEQGSFSEREIRIPGYGRWDD